jgi:NADPH:quinone reductase-like Zn-dependent oxidoreductase
VAKLPHIEGGRLLINGAGGAVGNYLVQLAVRDGWQVSTISHQRHWPRLWMLGATDCSSGPAEASAEPEVPMVASFDVVIDCVGADQAERLAPLLLANGHLVCIQGRIAQWPCTPFGRTLSLHEVALGALHVHGADRAWQALTAAGEQMLQSIAAGQMQPEPHQLHDFSVLPQTLEALKHRSFSGKPLIQLSW